MDHTGKAEYTFNFFSLIFKVRCWCPGYPVRFSFLFNSNQLHLLSLFMFSCSFFGLWDPVQTGFYVLLLLVKTIVSLLSDNIKMSQTPLVCFMSQTWNQLFLQLLSKFLPERILVLQSVLDPSWFWLSSVGMVFKNQDLVARCIHHCWDVIAFKILHETKPGSVFF